MLIADLNQANQREFHEDSANLFQYLNTLLIIHISVVSTLILALWLVLTFHVPNRTKSH